MRVRTLHLPILTLSGLVLVLGGAVGCGSDEPSAAPDGASREDFCRVNADAAIGGDLAATKDAVARLVEVGTPDDIPEDARAGFETLVEVVQQADDEAELAALDEDLGEEVQADLLGFFVYVSETCADELDLPTEEDLGDLGDLGDLDTDLQ